MNFLRIFKHSHDYEIHTFITSILYTYDKINFILNILIKESQFSRSYFDYYLTFNFKFSALSLN